MTCKILVLFMKDSEQLVKELYNHFDQASFNSVCLDDMAHPLLSCFQKLTKSRLQIIFFSPDFLKFLESKPLDIFYICDQMEAKSIIAVFCRGLKKNDVRCYHTAPLKSFISWKKFEVNEQKRYSSQNSIFPSDLIARIKNVIQDDCQETEEVTVVPQFVYKNNNVCYVIFSKPIEYLDGITIQLGNQQQNEIFIEKVNPYVIKFLIPDSLFQYSHSISLSVLKRDTIIAKQQIYISKETPMPLNPGLASSTRVNPLNLNGNSTTWEENNLDEQLRFLSDFSEAIPYRGISQPPSMYSTKSKEETSKDEDANESLVKLCKQYGLQQLSSFISGETTSFSSATEITLKEKKPNYKEMIGLEESDDGSKCKLPEMDASYQMNSFFVEESDIHNLRYTRRSLSLPSTLIPDSICYDSGGHYMDMSGGEIKEMETKPHEKLIQNMRNLYLQRAQTFDDEDLVGSPTSLSSGNYMTMTLTKDRNKGRLSMLKKGLSVSQQELLELLHRFKEGDTTISNVEDQFKVWREKHCSGDSSKRQKNRKISVFSFPWKSNNPKKKDSTTQDKKSTPNLKEVQENPSFSRKISSASASSNSSKASETSCPNTSYSTDVKQCSKMMVDSPPCPPYTGWVSSYSSAYSKTAYPLFSEKHPPPLPQRPPPSPALQPLLPKPIPLPRKSLQAKTATENEIKEEVSCQNFSKDRMEGEILQDTEQCDSEEPDTALQSLVDLCEKYGLDELGECFISGNCTLESQSGKEIIHQVSNDPRKKSYDCSKIADNEGHEKPLKPLIRNHNCESEKTPFQRSNSLPSNIHRSCEYADVMLPPDSIEAARKSFNCKSTDDELNSFAGRRHLYASIKLKSNSTAEDTKQDPNICLSRSQEELLELMYAFKRGDKTISQVEEQFKEWYAQHIGGFINLEMGQFHCKRKQEKTRKQSTFSIPGLKNFILGKPKKKIYREKQCPEVDPQKVTSRKASDTSTISTAIMNRLSKISFTSASSGCSDHNEVFRLPKGSGSNTDISGSRSSFHIAFPTKPLPEIPSKLPQADKLVSSNSSTDTNSEIDAIKRQPREKLSQKPILPPKPKMLFKSSATVTLQEPSSLELEPEKSGKESIPETNAPEPPRSPDYVIPENLSFRKYQRKKRLDSKDQATLRGRQKQTMPSSTRSSLGIPSTSGRYNDSTAMEGKTLPPETLKLLKEANLVCDSSDAEQSMFYIRRRSSFPNIHVSQPIYIEILDSCVHNPKKSLPPSESSG